MAPVPNRPRATFADLARLPDDARLEIIHGEIVKKALPNADHGGAQIALGGFLTHHFQRKPGGRWPGGWWFASEVDVEYAPHELFCHDVAGWRRERSAVRPTGRPVLLRPDWVCELLSTHRRRDLVDKFRVLQAAGVPHYWIVDPEEKVIIVHRLEPHGYLVALTAATGETVRAEPFDAVELRVGVVFGDEDDEE
jgi:Uma2 family endonuclease